MSRLYLKYFTSILFLVIVLSTNAQQDVNKLLKIGDEKLKSGDFLHALNYYNNAMHLDSNTIDVLWKNAEAYRLYKDYRKAEYYYHKVFKQEETKIYQESLLYLGLMQKQNGKFSEALETFKRAKKIYSKYRNNYVYIKAKQEFESCLWAISEMKSLPKKQVEKLSSNVNTVNSEFPNFIFDNKLFLTSLRPDSTVQEEIFSKSYKTKIYTSEMMESHFFGSKQLKELDLKGYNIGNGSFSTDKKRFYFSICKENTQGKYLCKIAVADFKNGSFTNIDTLGNIINEQNSNTTMPFVTMFEGNEVLFFSSDRNKKNKMDIFYSTITNGNTFGKVIEIKNINSIDDELSPFFDSKNNRLYFSSNWHYGLGGYDIFYSEYINGNFQKPINIGGSVNSSANEIYYFIHNDTSYFSSNRIGSYYSINPTCCTDIYRAHEKTIKKPEQATIYESLVELNLKLPVKLYFHNDCPDPKSIKTQTELSYLETYNDYIKLEKTYKNEYSTGLQKDKSIEAEEDIESFFSEYVKQGIFDLKIFTYLLLKELEKGTSVQIKIKGFASPLAKSDYNVNLTKRRISSLINYWKEYENGILLPYLSNSSENGSKIEIIEIPFGEYVSDKLVSDNPNDKKNSIYSRSASLERKIEIQSVNLINHTSPNVLTTDQQVYIIQKNNPLFSITLTNNSDQKIEIEKIDLPENYLLENPVLTVEANNSVHLKIKAQNEIKENQSSIKQINIHIKNEKKIIELIIIEK